MRLFIGIELPVELKDSLLQFQSELKSLGVNGYWKSQENFHITLEFLGELERGRIGLIEEVLFKVAKNNPPFKVSLGGIGAFPSFNRPHTLWTTLGGSLEGLNRLRDEIHIDLAERGFVLENRQFKPHITLASRPVLAKADLSSVYTRVLGEFTVSEVALFESSVILGKRVYSALHKASLGHSSISN
jgi:2'-5' RNA ligase